MIEFLHGRYEYWVTSALLLVGLYGILFKRNLLKKLIGLNILQSAIILWFVSLSIKPGATVPILPHDLPHGPVVYSSPLPHVLMLTAIVVAVSTTGVALALLIRIYRRFGTLDERVILGGHG